MNQDQVNQAVKKLQEQLMEFMRGKFAASDRIYINPPFYPNSDNISDWQRWSIWLNSKISLSLDDFASRTEIEEIFNRVLAQYDIPAKTERAPAKQVLIIC